MVNQLNGRAPRYNQHWTDEWSRDQEGRATGRVKWSPRGDDGRRVDPGACRGCGAPPGYRVDQNGNCALCGGDDE